MPRHWTNSTARRRQRSAVNYRLPIAPSPLPRRIAAGPRGVWGNPPATREHRAAIEVPQASHPRRTPNFRSPGTESHEATPAAR